MFRLVVTQPALPPQLSARGNVHPSTIPVCVVHLPTQSHMTLRFPQGHQHCARTCAATMTANSVERTCVRLLEVAGRQLLWNEASVIMSAPWSAGVFLALRSPQQCRSPACQLPRPYRLSYVRHREARFETRKTTPALLKHAASSGGTYANLLPCPHLLAYKWCKLCVRFEVCNATHSKCGLHSTSAQQAIPEGKTNQAPFQHDVHHYITTDTQRLEALRLKSGLQRARSWATTVKSAFASTTSNVAPSTTWRMWIDVLSIYFCSAVAIKCRIMQSSCSSQRREYVAAHHPCALTVSPQRVAAHHPSALTVSPQ